MVSPHLTLAWSPWVGIAVRGGLSFHRSLSTPRPLLKVLPLASSPEDSVRQTDVPPSPGVRGCHSRLSWLGSLLSLPIMFLIRLLLWLRSASGQGCGWWAAQVWLLWAGKCGQGRDGFKVMLL